MDLVDAACDPANLQHVALLVRIFSRALESADDSQQQGRLAGHPPRSEPSLSASRLLESPGGSRVEWVSGPAPRRAGFTHRGIGGRLSSLQEPRGPSAPAGVRHKERHMLERILRRLVEVRREETGILLLMFAYPFWP